MVEGKRRLSFCTPCTAHPNIYQGEEIGMTNVAFPTIDDYRDVETRNMYREFVEEKGIDRKIVMAMIHAKSRDNARTPMQWLHQRNPVAQGQSQLSRDQRRSVLGRSRFDPLLLFSGRRGKHPPVDPATLRGAGLPFALRFTGRQPLDAFGILLRITLRRGTKQQKNSHTYPKATPRQKETSSPRSGTSCKTWRESR